MFAANFCLNGGHKPVILFFHHGIPEDDEGEEIACEFAKDNGLEYCYNQIDEPFKDGLSTEEHWRHERYKWLYSLEYPIITGHHLNDVMETWIFSSLNGTPKLIPYNTRNIYRPFMLNTKDELKEWAVSHDVYWHEDILNKDTKYARCRIRHNIMPEALKINPGFGTVLKKRMKSGRSFGHLH